MNDNHILQAQHLKKSYRGKPVVRDVTLSVRSGQVVGLLGPNGAGKTTCFYKIVGSINGDGGNILFDDDDITPKPMHERARYGIGYLPQRWGHGLAGIQIQVRKVTLVAGQRAVFKKFGLPPWGVFIFFFLRGEAAKISSTCCLV